MYVAVLTYINFVPNQSQFKFSAVVKTPAILRLMVKSLKCGKLNLQQIFAIKY